MSKRKRDWVGHGVDDHSEPKDTKRRKHERRAAANTKGVMNQETSLQPVDGPITDDNGVVQTALARRLLQSRRKGKDRKRRTRDVSKSSAANNAAARREGDIQKRERRTERRRDKRERKRPQWIVSDPVGGQMLNIDPLFSLNEELVCAVHRSIGLLLTCFRYLLIACDTVINVYSTLTSVLVRRLRTRHAGLLSGFAFSSTDSNQLYISTQAGLQEKWDWINGVRLESWNTKVPIHMIRAAPPDGAAAANSLVYTIDRHTRERWLLTAHRLLGGQEAAKTGLVILLVYTEPLTSLKILDDGNVIVATSGTKIIIGTTKAADQPSLKEIVYVWREIECSEWITSIDVQIELASVRPEKSHLVGNGLNIVVGGLKGAIFIYENILRKLINKEASSKSNDEELNPRRLHWHRNAVAAVKWSADGELTNKLGSSIANKSGNYVISGGEETVLVLWQLETGRRQHLPHLSAAVQSIVVSPRGSSYGIRLSDNSAMILSTSELQPTFSIAGIQLPVTRRRDIQTPNLPTVDVPLENADNKLRYQIPAAVTPSGANRLLLAVPATASPNASSHACYLQTIDLNSGHQIGRQALTRTNVTSSNIGPEANKIAEPSVTHLKISSNGQWLATVDEWEPPGRDVGHLAFNDERMKAEQHLHLEVYLKFWSWDKATSTWELVSRINNPHATPSGIPRKVIALASDPSGPGFATLGEDSTVRAWKPAVRRRHDLGVRAPDGSILTTWICRQVSQIPAEAGPVGRLGYSVDGSVLFAALESSSRSSIHLIDNGSGEVRSSPTNLSNGPLFGLGILDQYLIILSDDLRVWDMVTEELHFGFSFEATGLSLQQRRCATHLAINHKYNSFAIAVPVSHSRSASRVAILEPGKTAPLFTTDVPCTMQCLLPAGGRIGYHCIDTAAEIRTVTPRQNLPTLNVKLLHDLEPKGQGIANIYGNGKANIEGEHTATPGLPSLQIRPVDSADEDGRVVKQEQLAEVFEAGLATNLPPVADLFERVAILFAGR